MRTTSAIAAKPQSVPTLEEHVGYNEGLSIHLDVLVHDNGHDPQRMFDFFITITVNLIPLFAQLRTLCLIGSSSFVAIDAAARASLRSAWKVIERSGWVVDEDDQSHAYKFI
ncbi:hypothetical protein FRB96_008040, partial [Tulasnella sp. 330]